jgi:hypothetical protein
MNRIITTTVCVAATAGITLGAAACGPTISKVSSGSPITTQPTKAPASSAPTTSGPTGTTFSVNSSDDNGNPVTYKVTLLKFDPDAQPDNSFDTAPSGDYLAGAEFQVSGVKGTASDDANSNAVAIGNDQQTYQTGFEGLADGTNFDSGQFNVSAGQSSVGWVAFEVKNGVTITSVKWTPESGMTSSSATWTVSNG